MLEIKSFSKSYGGDVIVSAEKLSFTHGIHLLKGDNGSGKTTLFKCLAGITPATGEVSIDGISLRKEPMRYRYLVNFAEAEPVYPSFLTAKDLMRFVATTKKAAPDQAAYYRHRLGIDWFFEKQCGMYSSGMLKKLSLALAFLGEPKVIMLDEPLITLDEGTRTNLYALMREKENTIFLLSSHTEIDHRFLELSATYCIRKKTVALE